MGNLVEMYPPDELNVGWSCGNAFYYGYGFDIRVVEIDD